MQTIDCREAIKQLLAYKSLLMRDDSGHTADMACRRIVRTLIEKFDWALLREDDLVELVLGSIQSEVVPAEVERLTKHHYTIALYKACRQTNDLVRRERGYYELFRFLFRAAYNHWPELAEDATQRALLLAYEQIDRCRSPGTFLAFAQNKLRHAFQQEQRARGQKKEMPWPPHKINQITAERDWPVLQSCLDQQELLPVLLEAIELLPDERKRKAILLKFLAGWSDEEIGAHLGVTPDHVRVLRHRGIARLRKDERLRGYFKEKNCEEDREKRQKL